MPDADPMDAATLRIILLVLGAVLLVAIYLWERRRMNGGAGPRPRARARPAARRREPRFGDDAGDGSDADPVTNGSARRRAHPTGVTDVAARSAAGTGSGAVEADALDAMAEPDPEAPPVGDGLLVQLFVFAGEQGFDGIAVQTAAARQQLVPGEFDIYHRQSLDGVNAQTRFSMANLVKPGTFPFDAMEGFVTPGLALFSQFDGRPSDLMVYDELVVTARALANELGGDLCLPDRRPFDVASWERLRNELLALINERADALAGTGYSPDRDEPRAAGADRRAAAEEPVSPQRP